VVAISWHDHFTNVILKTELWNEIQVGSLSPPVTVSKKESQVKKKWTSFASIPHLEKV
jgi:hypothetical protein